MIVEPPSDDGALQVTVACLLPAVAETFLGAPGTVAGADVGVGVGVGVGVDGTVDIGVTALEGKEE